MKLAIAQINTRLGDLKDNSNKILDYLSRARKMGCDLVLFPRLALSGYAPETLLKRPDFLAACDKAFKTIIKQTKGIGLILNLPLKKPEDGRVYDAYCLIEDERVTATIYRRKLGSLGEEQSMLSGGSELEPMTLSFRGLRLGILAQYSYGSGLNMASLLGLESIGQQIDILMEIADRPYSYGEYKELVNRCSSLADGLKKPFIYINQVGGNGETIYSGNSLVFNKEGGLVKAGKVFDEDLIVHELFDNSLAITEAREDIGWVYRALVLGLRDYMRKTGLKKALLGLSGGIDSALAACLAAEALGRENVLGVNMPSKYSPQHSIDDARELAKNLGIEFRLLPIGDIFNGYINLMNTDKRTVGDLAEENIQARIRGDLLMYISNREGHMLICPSNKSEASVGYTTMYGDMCGGLAILADIPKTLVYELSRYVNRDRVIIPENTIRKPPSAELRPDQVDEDSLPPYEILDPIIDMYLEQNLSVDDMVNRGYEKDVLVTILNMIDRAEYKRRQMPPVVRITSNPSNLGVKIPLINGFSWTSK
ncbi:MAG: NAD+ synthase [Eubacteriales bacterium]|jgi:NAD+ synthase (glutamine-hydrolysing)|nr:NAD+ synthase [Clostridia bacterium]